MTRLTKAIIPARGGSKGIPGKNILPIAGKPLIAWTIEAALKAQSIKQVIVSTDDPEIARISSQYGAEIVWRPKEISGDYSSSETALLHALDSDILSDPHSPEIITFLQCTSPLTLPEDIDGTVLALLNANADTALTVAEFHYFLWEKDKDGNLNGLNHDKSVRKMRQERKSQFLETGAVYVMKTDGFRHYKHRFFGRTAFYTMPPERVLEIDEPIDFKIAEILLNERKSKLCRTLLPNKIGLLVFDFDGVQTNDTVLIDQDGKESVYCSRADGMGIELARKAGIPMLILSKESNSVVKRRAEKLKVPVLNGIDDKYVILEQYLSAHKIAWREVIYVGNDVNDLKCMETAGCGVAVSNANPLAKSAANIVLTREGGQHAIRELIDLILHNPSSNT